MPAFAAKPSSSRPRQPKRPTGSKPHGCAFSSVALLLQGGGALGSYQAGVYEALDAHGLLPDWVCGISIGAINAAIIAGNAPQDRVAQLRSFWNTVTQEPVGPAVVRFWGGDSWRKDAHTHVEASLRALSASWSLLAGKPGFFLPRARAPHMAPEGSLEALSYYDTSPLRDTLLAHVDFDRLNSKGRDVPRFTTSAVDVVNGNYRVFDSRKHLIRVEHVMASGALPPGLPPVEIDGRYYWDGGLISNTPLKWVLDEPAGSVLAFQVDLWSSVSKMPSTITEVATRQKEIQFSSRTRAVTSQFAREQHMRHAIAHLYDKLPKALREAPEMQYLRSLGQSADYHVVHLIYRAKDYEGFSMDFEFSPHSMQERWRVGLLDTERALSHPEIFHLPAKGGIAMFDFGRRESN